MKTYTKIWSKDYETNYLKDYVKDYDAVYTKIWEKDYTKIWSKNYVKAYERIWTVWVAWYSGVQAYVSPKAYTTTYEGVLTYTGNFASGSYIKDYLKTWEAEYTKTYTQSYTKNYDVLYTGTWHKSWDRIYEAGYENSYEKIWLGQLFYGGYGNGNPSTGSYQKFYTKVWTREWVKSYDAAYEKTYEKSWLKDYSIDYNKVYTKLWEASYSKNYEGGSAGTRTYSADVSFLNPDTAVSYVGVVNYTTGQLFFGVANYLKTYTKTYTKIWSADYTKIWNDGSDDYTKVYSKDWSVDYNKDYIKTYEGEGIFNYRGTFDGLADYGASYTKIWNLSVNYLQAYSPTYTGNQYFEVQWSGERTSHATYMGETNFIGPTSGALASSKPRLFAKSQGNWQQVKNLWLRVAGIWKEVPFYHTKEDDEWKLSHIGYKQTEIYLSGTSTGPTANTETTFYMRGENIATGTPDTLGDNSSKGSQSLTGHDGAKTAHYVNEFHLKEFLDHKGRASGTYPTMTTIHVGQQDQYDNLFVMGSNTASRPAIDLTGFSAISINTVDGGSAVNFPHLVRIVTYNNGYIVGHGGDGGDAAADAEGGAGADGGPAIKTDSAVTLYIENYGTIGGGGAGGGAGGLTMYTDASTGTKSSEFAAHSGSGGGGGAGFTVGAAGDTESAVTAAAEAGSLLTGGAGAKPNIATTHNSRVPGGKGGDLGGIGFGANMDSIETGASTRTIWAMSGDGGTPGKAIDGYDASRVFFVGQGTSNRGFIAGDETFKLA